MAWILIACILKSVSDVEVYSDLTVNCGYGLNTINKDPEIAFWCQSVQRDKRDIRVWTELKNLIKKRKKENENLKIIITNNKIIIVIINLIIIIYYYFILVFLLLIKFGPNL